MTGSPIYEAALRIASLVSRLEKPTPFAKRLQNELEVEQVSPDSRAFLDLLRNLAGNDPLLNELGRGLHRWDAVPNKEGADWVGGTEPCTKDRRDVVCRLLGLTGEEGQVLLDKRPVFVSGTTVISAESWDPWYTDNVAAGRNFYWRHYERYLLEEKKWPQQSVSSVDQATTRVMERLTNPTRPEAYQSKGLVVGYVQSGKTANFTGVIAKAIDAGYRLVIVMTGTIELLRGQTQRRVDMELVGKKNIVGDLPEDQRPDYLEDSDWERFSVFDEDPETSIVRLTERARDYRRGQFQRLQFERPIREKPLFDKDNLFRINARLAVVKKNKGVLTHLVNDIRANKNAFAEIPVLIIDDEADQATVNTVNPEKVRKAKKEGEEVAKRKAINKLVAQMLELMPRAQYVGYTATPFANVFTDPSDEQGIYPKDFVIGLDRPPGYMGVEDFHDLEEAERQSGMSNEKAYVRPLRASSEPERAGERAKELARALDSFVLAGAVKLWRESQDGKPFRHHTMLIHEAVSKQQHAELAKLVRDTWRDGGYTTAAGAERLGDFYEKDVLPVSRERCEEGVPRPPAWAELRTFVGKAVGRITEFEGNPVLVVNSDKDINQHQQELNFDAHRVWRILIGGTKLSRGFTVEGLTVTYFRRATDLSDSLTQMGRWFGFRHGYRDLIRLYIARNVKKGRRDIDLYKAFEGIAQAENDFRAQLKSYARLGPDGRPYVTPKQVPCLVRQYLPWLQPTARNKMFNAKLRGEMKQPFEPTGLGQGAVDNRHNLGIWQKLLSGIGEPIELPQGGGTFRARVVSVSAADFIDSIEILHYVDGYTESAVKPAVFAYRKALEEGSIDNFLLVLPQLATTQVTVEGVGPLTTISRKRSRGPLFHNISDPKHREVVDDFVRGKPASGLGGVHSAKAGAVLVYLINEGGSPEDGHVFAYSAYVPQGVASGPASIPTFSVHTEAQGDAVTVDASGVV